MKETWPEACAGRNKAVPGRRFSNDRKEGVFISKVKEVREPAEKAFPGFLTDVGYTGGSSPEGIPAVSLLYHDGEDVVSLRDILLPDVDREIQERGLWEKDILYRVDYLWGGKPRKAMGRLEAGNGRAAFLDRAGGIADDGDVEPRMLCLLLKKHLSLCSLEALARREISPQGQCAGETAAGNPGEDGLHRQADDAYYREVLAYTEEARRILNRQPCPALPPFPERGRFMAAWYRDHKGGGRHHED